MRLREISTDARKMWNSFESFLGISGTEVTELPARGSHGEHGVARGKPLLLPTVAIDHALDSISQAVHIEINEQADTNSAQSHV